MTRARIGRPRLVEGTWCCRCRTQDPAAFPPSALKANKGTLCRECHRKYNANRYGPGIWLAYQKAGKERKRTFVRERKAALGCKECGEKHPACLEFHHRDKEAKSFNVGMAVARNWTLSRIEAEMAKCDVLCANCHRKLHDHEIGLRVARSPLDISQLSRSRKQRHDAGKRKTLTE